MKKLYNILALCALALGLGNTLAQGLDPTQGPAPALQPASRVAHAGTAAVLASAQAGSRIVSVGDHGVVMLSDDQAKTWRQAAQVPVDSMLTGVSFVDARNGWAVGHWGVIIVTHDGGEHWALQRSAPQEDRPLFAVHMFDPQQGVAVGLWSLVLRTSDGGQTWDKLELPAPQGAKKADYNLLGLFATGDGDLLATAEHGTLLRSSDQGQHWRYVSTGYTGTFWTGLALPNGVLLAAGLRGSLYRSDDNGKSWSRVTIPSTASITTLALVGQQIMAGGLDGLTLRSDDAGLSFKMTVRSDHASITSILATNQGKGLLFSRQGYLNP
jgi:photosystem II stability/assembly factor-like uncharacterized protein